MVLESNRDLVVRRLVECLGRDRTKHQVAEVTSLGLVQMTRKRVGQGLLESFSEPCEHCNGRGVKIFLDPVDPKPERERDRAPKVGAKAPLPPGSASAEAPSDGGGTRPRRRRGGRGQGSGSEEPGDVVSDLPVSAEVLVTEPLTSGSSDEDVPAQEEAVEAPFDLAEQPSTAAEDVPVVPPAPERPAAEPVDEPPAAAEPAKAAAPKRRRAAGRPAGAPTV
jgi:ribonuclease E